ncbi:unnamed protein product [Linum trigynum]|uniref:Uncharacterized protein n=1 Tax=Linum trigynum TaxID=586398 RepID=A0AAV2GIR9_9ROSI
MWEIRCYGSVQEITFEPLICVNDWSILQERRKLILLNPVVKKTFSIWVSDEVGLDGEMISAEDIRRFQVLERDVAKKEILPHRVHSTNGWPNSQMLV